MTLLYVSVLPFLGFPRFELPKDLKPQLQIRAGAEKSTDTREITNRYCKSGITRSIPRCADAVAMLVMFGYGTSTNQNIEARGRHYSTLWYPPTSTSHATRILRYR